MSNDKNRCCAVCKAPVVYLSDKEAAKHPHFSFKCTGCGLYAGLPEIVKCNRKVSSPSHRFYLNINPDDIPEDPSGIVNAYLRSPRKLDFTKVHNLKNATRIALRVDRYRISLISDKHAISMAAVVRTILINS